MIHRHRVFGFRENRFNLMKRQAISRFRGVKGFTLVEISVGVLLLTVLSFAVFKGARITSEWLNVKIAERQAASLVNLLRVDYALAKAERPIIAVTDFFGHLYTQQWPAETASLFNSVSRPVDDFDLLEVDQKGCVVNISELRPCFTESLGFWVEFDARPAVQASGSNPAREAQVRQVRMSIASAQKSRESVNAHIDAQTFQTHYLFRQISRE